MDFQLSEEQLAFQSMAAKFAEEKLAPMAASWDENSFFPSQLLREEVGPLGFGGMVAGEDIGGGNLKRLDAALVFEQLATGCISTSAYLSIHNMVTSLLDSFANPSLRQEWGPRLTSMQALGSYCLTEPDSGSDAASLKTRAKAEGDFYLINGAKAFISGAGESDVYLCMVRTGEESYKGISCLLVEKNRPGLSFGKLEKKMGWRSQPTSMLYFENCRVPRRNLVGDEGMGFRIALKALNGGRINIGACSLGGALACLRFTQTYLHERKQFKQNLSKMQGLRFYFADMLTDFTAARLMVYKAATALDIGDSQAPVYCAMAKKMATDFAFSIADKALQLHGGYGYLQDYQIERIVRDLRVHRILEGTNEIMREIIAKTCLDESYVIV